MARGASPALACGNVTLRELLESSVDGGEDDAARQLPARHHHAPASSVGDSDIGWVVALHSARADLLRRLDRREEAAAAYRAALALEMNVADRAFLERRLAEVAAAK